MDTNVIGPAVVSAAFRPLLLKSQKPYSIYVSSGMRSMAKASDPTSITYRGLPNGEAYRASKAALNMMVLPGVDWVQFDSHKGIRGVPRIRTIESSWSERRSQEWMGQDWRSTSFWRDNSERYTPRARCRCWSVCSWRWCLSLVRM